MSSILNYIDLQLFIHHMFINDFWRRHFMSFRNFLCLVPFAYKLQFVHAKVSSFCTANICDMYFFMGTLLEVLSAQNIDIQSQITITRNLWTDYGTFIPTSKSKILTWYGTNATDRNYNYMKYANRKIFSQHQQNLILANEAFKRDFINCIHNLHKAQMPFSWFIHGVVASPGSSDGYWKWLCWLATSRICCWELDESDLKLWLPPPLKAILKQTRSCSYIVSFTNVQ